VRKFAKNWPKQAQILRFPWYKVHRLQKSTPPPIVTVVTNISYAKKKPESFSYSVKLLLMKLLFGPPIVTRELQLPCVPWREKEFLLVIIWTEFPCM